MRIRNRWLYLFALAAFLGFFLLPPVFTAAQTDRTGLVIRPLPVSYNPEVTRGRDNLLLVEVVNTDNVDIADISLKSTQPEGWSVEFSPASIALLRAGSSQVVDVHVIPPQNVGRGYYDVTLLAETNEIRTTTSIFVRVQGPSPLWLWIGAGVGALIVALFVIIFLRSGRQ